MVLVNRDIFLLLLLLLRCQRFTQLRYGLYCLPWFKNTITFKVTQAGIFRYQKMTRAYQVHQLFINSVIMCMYCGNRYGMPSASLLGPVIYTHLVHICCPICKQLFKIQLDTILYLIIDCVNNQMLQVLCTRSPHVHCPGQVIEKFIVE